MPIQKTAVPGFHIRYLRQIKGFKQREAARKLGITQQAYSKIERCKELSERMIRRVITAFNSNQEELDKATSIFSHTS